MKIFLTVIVVSLLIVIADLLFGIVQSVTAPEGRGRDVRAAEQVLLIAEDQRGDSEPRGGEGPWSTGVNWC